MCGFKIWNLIYFNYVMFGNGPYFSSNIKKVTFYDILFGN